MGQAREELGRYRRGVLIGRGATCDVYEAHSASLGGPFALKVAASREGRRALAREAELAVQVTHPRLAGVIESIRDVQGNLAALAMKMLHGKRLSSLRAEQGRLPWRWGVSCLVQVLDAVGAIHQAGYLHGDINPGNVMVLGDEPLDAEPDVMLLDLGSAVPLREPVSQDADEGVDPPAVTAAYAAPELYGLYERTVASDLYSVAVMAFELLSGVLPFTGETEEDTAFQHIHREPPRLEGVDVSAGIPPHVALAVHRGLTKDPNARFSSARAFAAALSGDPDEVRDWEARRALLERVRERWVDGVLEAGTSRLAPAGDETVLLLRQVRQLLDRWHNDVEQPMPVVFSMSERAPSQGSIIEWMTRRLESEYGVARDDAERWAAGGSVLPFLVP